MTLSTRFRFYSGRRSGAYGFALYVCYEGSDIHIEVNCKAYKPVVTCTSVAIPDSVLRDLEPVPAHTFWSRVCEREYYGMTEDVWAKLEMMCDLLRISPPVAVGEGGYSVPCPNSEREIYLRNRAMGIRRKYAELCERLEEKARAHKEYTAASSRVRDTGEAVRASTGELADMLSQVQEVGEAEYQWVLGCAGITAGELNNRLKGT